MRRSDGRQSSLGYSIPALIRALRQKFDSQGFPDLHPGDRLDAQVTRKLGEGKILVLLKGTQVEADTKIPLQVGQKIQVQSKVWNPRFFCAWWRMMPPGTR